MNSSPKGQTVHIGRILRGVEYVAKSVDGQPENGANGTGKPAGPTTSQLIDAAYEQGRAKGREEALRELAPTAVALKQMMDVLTRETKDHASAIDRFATRLSLRIAAKILDREVSDPAALTHMIASALSQIPLSGPLQIRLNPLDVVELNAFLGQALSKNVFLPKETVLVADPSLRRGGCVIDNGTGRLDARIETQLSLIEKALEAYPDKERARG